jgi:hypothetical protein
MFRWNFLIILLEALGCQAQSSHREKLHQNWLKNKQFIHPQYISKPMIIVFKIQKDPSTRMDDNDSSVFLYDLIVLGSQELPEV